MKRVLIVEDDEGIIEAMKTVLTEYGYKVKAVSDGELAFETIVHFKPQLVLLDMLMSGVDGREVCAKIKANTFTKGVRVVMVSAHPSARDSVFKFGADDFLAKPFEVDELLSVAKKYTNRK